MKQPIHTASTFLWPVAAALFILSYAPAQGGEVPGKTNISGFYPTWYYPGHRNYHGTALWVPDRAMRGGRCARDGVWVDGYDGHLTRRERRGAVIGGAAIGLATGSWVGAGIGAVAGARIADRRWDDDGRHDRRRWERRDRDRHPDHQGVGHRNDRNWRRSHR